MPQLDTATYVGQVTWLVIVLGGLYRATRSDVLPKLSRIVKMRSKKRDRTRVDATQYDGERAKVEDGYSGRLGNAAKSSYTLLQETADVQSGWMNAEAGKRNQSTGRKGARTHYRTYRVESKLADTYITETLGKTDTGEQKAVKKEGKKAGVSTGLVKKGKGKKKGKASLKENKKPVKKTEPKAKPVKGTKKGPKKS